MKFTAIICVVIPILAVANAQIEREGAERVPIVFDERGPSYSIDGSESSNGPEPRPPTDSNNGNPFFPFSSPFGGQDSPFGASFGKLFQAMTQRFEEMAQRMREQMLNRFNETQMLGGGGSSISSVDLSGSGSNVAILNGEPVPEGTNVTKEELVTLRGRQFIKKTRIINKQTPHGRIFVSSVSYEPYVDNENESPIHRPATPSTEGGPLAGSEDVEGITSRPEHENGDGPGSDRLSEGETADEA